MESAEASDVANAQGQKIEPTGKQSATPVKSLSVTYAFVNGIDHAGHSILTLDISPVHIEPLRVVTAGKDGAVKVWSIKDCCKEENADTCTCLAAMVEHLSPVNCVRWSTDASFIASGDIDGTLLVWWQDPRFPVEETEPWRRKWLFRGHEAEICDISWHPSMHPGFTLASCSFDGSIRLWSVITGEMSVVLRSPDGSCVKGVTFDPLGQFLAAMPDASSATRSHHALMWECPNDNSLPWRQVPIANFSKSNSTAIPTLCVSQRPSWDPLGMSVAFPCGGTSKRKRVESHFGVIFEREEWKAPMRFVGHLSTISHVRFSPISLGEPNEHNEIDNLCTICAFASNNGTISIHMSAMERPLVSIVSSISGDDFITDMCWTPGGDALISSTNDGHVMCLGLSFENIGKTMTTEQIDMWRAKQRFSSLGWLGAVSVAHLEVANAASIEANKRMRFTSQSQCQAQQDVSLSNMEGWVNKCVDARTCLRKAGEQARLPDLLWVANGDDYIEIRMNLAQHELRNDVVRIEARSASDAYSRMQRIVGTPFWKTSLNGRITAACMCWQYAAFVAEHSDIPVRLLHVLDTHSGSQLIAPLVMESPTNVVHFPSDGRGILIIDQQHKLQVLSFEDPCSPVLVLRAKLPSGCEHPHSVRLIPSSLIPFYRETDGAVYAFNKNQQIWSRIDTYGLSQCRISQSSSQDTVAEFLQKCKHTRWRGRQTDRDRECQHIQNTWLLQEFGPKTQAELSRCLSDYESASAFGKASAPDVSSPPAV